MKKTLLILICGFGMMASCKKDRVCECIYGTTVDRIEYKKVTKKWMINSAECVSRTYYDTGNFGQQIITDVNCTIK